MALQPTPELKQWLIVKGLAKDGGSDSYFVSRTGDAIQRGDLDMPKLQELLGHVHPTEMVAKQFFGPAYDEIVGGGNSGTGGSGSSIRVKTASERYSKSKTVAHHKTMGTPVTFCGTPVSAPSELELAKIGCWFKHFQRSNADRLTKLGMPIPSLNEHESHLLAEMYSDGLWTGSLGGDSFVDGAKSISELRLNTKSLLNDSLSGGTNLVPFDFDSAVVTFPLLHSELLPRIDLKDTVRDEVQTASIQNPTAVWGTGDGTTISLFDTDSMLANITATVHPVTIGVLYGRDLAADSPVALGNTLVEIVGNVLRKELDRVIAVGNGTSEPTGLFTTSGLASVTSGGNAPTIDDYLSLMFSVEKQYRNPAMNPAYIGNDTSYQRVRSIPVDSSSDARLIHGMNVQSYSLFDNVPYLVQNDIANTKIGYFCLKKYRLWRRSGFTFEITMEGESLMRRNEALLVARGRYAGKFVDVNAGAVTTDAQA